MNTLTPVERSYSASQLALIKRTVAADCNDQEFALFIEVARRKGLDPFARQIHAVVYNKDKPDKRKLSIITAIDGLRAIAARGRDYRPSDHAATIDYNPDLKNEETNPLGIERAEVHGFKLAPDGQWHRLVGEAYWDEFCPLVEEWGEDEKGKRAPTGRFFLPRTSKWRSMGRVMISKCAEAQMLRKGWPEVLSGIYGEEEMDRAHAQDAAQQVELYETEERLKRVNAFQAIAVQWDVDKPMEMVPVGKMADRILAFLKECQHPMQVQRFRETNQVSLQQFWAMQKGDALAVKAAMEKREAELQPRRGAT